MKCKKNIFAITLTLVSHSTLAGQTCYETVLRVIPHSNGEIYFVTDQTCSTTWCQVKWSTADSKKNALSTLLAALTTNRKIDFYWPTLT